MTRTGVNRFGTCKELGSTRFIISSTWNKAYDKCGYSCRTVFALSGSLAPRTFIDETNPKTSCGVIVASTADIASAELVPGGIGGGIGGGGCEMGR
jgi:hypothetical protein